MKISELIEELQEKLRIEGDLEVMSSSNYGDYNSTEQLDPIGTIESCIPRSSAYSGSGLAFPFDRDEDDSEFDYDEPGQERILVLRYRFSY